MVVMVVVSTMTAAVTVDWASPVAVTVLAFASPSLTSREDRGSNATATDHSNISPM